MQEFSVPYKSCGFITCFSVNFDVAEEILMRYKINSPIAYTRKMKTKVFLRWFFYSLTLILLYSLMSCGAFGFWQPYFIAALAIGVSMREQEVSSSVFGIFCGFMLDMAMGTLFGFFAVCLMPCCFLTSLFSRNLIKVNFLNHIIFTSISTLITFIIYYLFNYVIWNMQGREIIIFRILLPSFIATAVTAPAIYFLVKLIANKLGLADSVNINDAVEEVIEHSDDAADNK